LENAFDKRVDVTEIVTVIEEKTRGFEA